jgi:hypothetical protein
MNSVFFDIALSHLRPLTKLGASISTELACKCDIITIRKEAKRIEIAYEPYGPPSCDVKFGSEHLKRIEVDVAFLSGQRMGGGDKSAAAITALENDLQAYIEALYPILEHELR